jgi:hypothetical protein
LRYTRFGHADVPHLAGLEGVVGLASGIGSTIRACASLAADGHGYTAAPDKHDPFAVFVLHYSA